MAKKSRETILLDELEAAHQAETAALVAARGQTHGDWDAHATCTQDLKDTLSDHLKRRGQARSPLTATQLEALHMILHKIGRIVAGDPNFKDHWDDIAGYAKITADRL